MTKRQRNIRKMKKKTRSISVVEGVKPVSKSELTSSEIIEKLLSEATSSINTFNYEGALEACQKVLEIDSTNLTALEMLASVHVENGNFSEAKNIYIHCTELSPDDGYLKYFSLGQLSGGKEAQEFYEKGIVILKKKLDNPNAVGPSEDSQAPLCRALSDAYCSIAEIYMTDCCFEEDAESRCKKCIESAIEADESNPEAHQCLANFHLTRGDIEESKSAINKSLSLWLPQYRAIWEGEVSSDETDFEPPNYDSRINSSKMLIELGLLDEAGEVLDGLVTEDDEVVEVWYLLGWSHYLRGDEYKKNAVYYFNKAKEVYKKVGVGDEDQIEHMNELLEEMSGICESEESDIAEDDFPSESEESDTENCDVEMQQNDL